MGLEQDGKFPLALWGRT